MIFCCKLLDSLVRLAEINKLTKSIVLQVAPVGGIEAVFKTLRQPVEIVHILKGSDLIDETIGEQIYITRASWCLFFDDMTANLGFVNTMRHGQYYLIFLEGKVELPEAQKLPTNIYYLCNTIVTPVFSYTEGEDVVIPIDTVPTYVPYQRERPPWQVQGFCWVLVIFLAPIMPRIGFYGQSASGTPVGLAELFRLVVPTAYILEKMLHTSDNHTAAQRPLPNLETLIRTEP